VRYAESGGPGSALAAESLGQLVSMWKRFAGDRPNADLRDRLGLSVCWAESEFPLWNAVFLTEQIWSPEHLSARLRDASRFVRTKRQSGRVFVCEGYLNGRAKAAVDTVAMAEGFERVAVVTGMVGSMPPGGQSSRSASLRFVRVTTEEAWHAFADIYSEANGLPLKAGLAGFGTSRLWKETAFAYIGFVDGKAISTASAIVDDGQIHLALVATKLAEQCKGFGEASARHALQAAYDATGLRRSAVHTTDAAYTLCCRIGYRPISRFFTYSGSS
jgi:hypothetical protein